MVVNFLSHPVAFAYLQKPVDIDVLSETLKRANEKIQAQKKKTGIS
jgi:YesN/AraC family two-component response regulator